MIPHDAIGRILTTITERGNVSVELRQITRLQPYRTHSGMNFWACQERCEAHRNQCFYEINHRFKVHRYRICLQDFFPGMQKSKQALSSKASFHSTSFPDFMLPASKEGESDFDDGSTF